MVTDLAIDPRGTSDNVIYISTNDGGVWKTADGGATWAPLTDDQGSNSIGAVALDPSNPDVVYAGTGNVDNNGFFKGIGIYRSPDGGQTWQPRGANLFGGVGIIRMRVLASGALLVATKPGRVPLDRLEASASATMRRLTTTARRLLAAGSRTSASTPRARPPSTRPVWGGGIMKSTNGGASFPTNLFANPGAPAAPFTRISFAQSTAPNASTMYASVAQSGGSPGFKGLYKSINGGGSWTRLAAGDGPALDPNYDGTGANAPCQCGYDLTLGVDPQDANRLYMGFQELWRSTDGGATFDPAPVSRSQLHWDHHALAFSPPAHRSAAPTRLWAGTGGIASSPERAGVDEPQRGHRHPAVPRDRHRPRAAVSTTRTPTAARRTPAPSSSRPSFPAARLAPGHRRRRRPGRGRSEQPVARPRH